MKQRKLGAHGPMVSEIAFGTMSFGNFFGPTDEPTSHACLDAVHEAGIDFLDTAEIYGAGLSETIIGNYTKKHPNRFKIATKGGIAPREGSRFDNSRAYFRKALEGSLARLQTDYVDLYYIHRRDTDVPIEDVVGTMKEFIQEGKIGGYGLSEVSPTTLRRAHSEHPPLAVQSEYSLWTRLPELGMIQECTRLGVAFVPFSPLARGMLTDHQPVPEKMEVKDFRRTNPRFMRPNYDDNLSAIKPFQEYAKERGVPTSALALAWVLAQGDHLIPIPATRTAEHFREWSTANQITLSEKDLREIETILPVGWAWGDRYSAAQNIGPETYA